MKNVETKFWSLVNKCGPVAVPRLGPCWLWTKGTNGDGYGILNVSGKPFRAHRISFLMFRCLPSCQKSVLHMCDVRRCVNPHHLYFGTQADNVNDMKARGRLATGDKNGSRLKPDRYPKGENHSTAKLSNDNVREIRSAYGTPGIRMQDLADRYGVSKAAIHRVLKTGWKNIL